MRTQQRDGRAGSASGRTSMRRLWPTSTVLMSRPFSNFTVLPTPVSPRQIVAPKHLLPPHISTIQSTQWTPSTALSWPVTTPCWAHRCRSARGSHLHVGIHVYRQMQCSCNSLIIQPLIRHYINLLTDRKLICSKLAFFWLTFKSSRALMPQYNDYSACSSNWEG